MEEIYKRFDGLSEKINKLEAIMNVMADHIEVLEKRSEKITDKFKFGRFRFRKLSDDLPKISLEKRASFSLNDD
ncbi:hypothetical protein CFVI97532_07160 [Campylobacter fetus subsp. venerealis cfvi97/532]|nr:hypothetical protein CFVI97532_07160 [Campylobacter fetus subsp. venerealis cfvi97/532]